MAEKDDKEYSFSVEYDNPNALKLIKAVVDSVNKTENEIIKANVELYAKKPLEINLFSQESTQQKTKNESTGTHICEICGEEFETGGGLGSHKYFKHSNDDENIDIDIPTDTNRFYTLSVLQNSSKPIVPKDIEKRLEGTEWASQRSSISATLGKLYENGLTERNKRSSERGKPYEYTITEEGEKVVKNAIEYANKNNESTFEDVIEGK